MKTYLHVSLLIISFLFNLAGAQISEPHEIHAKQLKKILSIDGQLSEVDWQRAERISNFTQRELDEGETATERTEAAVLFDDQNLYIGIWCYDDEPRNIIAQKLQRDFDPDGEDNIFIVLDTYHDRRNGYLFATNPAGARTDALIMDNGRNMNIAWDGVWTVKTSINHEGWFAEFQIPFSTLKFESSAGQTWGINFERNIRRKREQVLWQGWSRDAGIEQVSRAGVLTGIRGIGAVSLVELKPYGSGGIAKSCGKGVNGVSKIGADINYLITPTMKLNITTNTDFAQVESDRAQVNLTRFSLFYPEKREFFLEGRNYFNFGLGHSIQPFYTRRIGLTPERKEIPIIGGVRFLGKSGDATLGGMTIQTAAKDTVQGTNYTVLRWKQDILEQSNFGLIGVGKTESGRKNLVYGADFLYSTAKLFGDKNLSVGGALAQSYTSDGVSKTGMAHRLFFYLPNDFIDFSAIWDRSDKNFNPETGFLRRTNYQMYNADFRIKPRPKFLPWIQHFVFKPFDFNYYIEDDTGELQSLWSEFRPLGFTTTSGEFFEFNIQRSAEHLNDDFEIQDDVVIPQGEYWYTHYELQFETFQGRPVYGELYVNWGDYYNGSRTKWALDLSWRINRHFSLSGNVERTAVQLPAGNFIVDELAARVTYAVNPDLFGSLFAQWNNEDNEALLNFRMNWIPTPGTDFYFVVNQTIETESGNLQLVNTTVLSKLIWRLVL